ncbi:MAG TPA: hypothetical protein VFD82_24625 [Planctomycetota bacterium]|nr:hypothetical protein [Planctomycetota bacterium]
MRALLLLFVAGTVTAQTTWIVGGSGPTGMPSLSAAVAAAVDGDKIVISQAMAGEPGTVVITKSLRIFGNIAGGGAPLLLFGNGGLDIQIAAGKELVFANCRLLPFAGQFPAAVNISNSAGRVVLQDLTGYFRLTISQSQQVLLSRLDIGTDPGTAITASVVALDRCTLHGRDGQPSWGLQSAQAMLLDSSTVHGMNTTLRGGDQGIGKTGPDPSYPGSRALTAVSSSLTLSGAGSIVSSGTMAVGPTISSTGSTFVFHPGLQPTIGGTFTVTTRFLPTVSSNGFVSGGNANLIVTSPPGAPTALLFGAPGDRLAIPGVSGDLWIDPQAYCIPAVGVGGASWAVTVPPSPVLFGQAYRWQGLVLSQGLELGGPGSALLR